MSTPTSTPDPVWPYPDYDPRANPETMEVEFVWLDRLGGGGE